MSVYERASWHAQAWGGLLRRAVTYPIKAADTREAMLVAARSVDAQYLPTVRADVFAAGLDDSATVTLSALETRDHNCSIFELLTLGMIARHVQPRRALEIGTYDGRSALAIAMNALPNSEIITLNLPADHVAETGTTEVDALLQRRS
jgi:predicted O-methyltransferase YrrM